MTDNHEEISGSLAFLIRGELGEADERHIRDHLRDCGSCAQEHTAVAALLSDEIEPLRDDERARLRTAIDAARNTPAVADIRRRKASLERLAPALTAAAVVVALMAGVTLIRVQDGGGDGAADGSAGDVTGKRAVEAPRGGRGAAEALIEDQTAGVAAADRAALPQPVFVSGTTSMAQRALKPLGRGGSPFVDFARSYSAEDVPALQDRFVRKLAAAAPDPPGPEAVRDCARVVLDSQEPSLPAYGRYGRLGATLVLLLGFAWTDDASGPLDRYMFWAWPRGACERLGHYEAGRIKQAP